MNMTMHISLIELFIIFALCVMLYVAAMAITEYINAKHDAAERKEELIFQARLHHMINSNRQAMPANEWFDVRK